MSAHYIWVRVVGLLIVLKTARKKKKKTFDSLGLWDILTVARDQSPCYCIKRCPPNQLQPKYHNYLKRTTDHLTNLPYLASYHSLTYTATMCKQVSMVFVCSHMQHSIIPTGPGCQSVMCDKRTLKLVDINSVCWRCNSELATNYPHEEARRASNLHQIAVEGARAATAGFLHGDCYY